MARQHPHQWIMPLALLAIGTFTTSLTVLTAEAAQEPPAIKKVPVTPTSAGSGKEMFNAYCASCHGVDGKGDGPAASALKRQPTDLTLLARRNGGKFPTTDVMNSIDNVTENAHGAKDMPIWGPLLSSVSNGNPNIVRLRIHNIAQYIGSLQAK